jgi:hypothetical protein
MRYKGPGTNWWPLLLLLLAALIALALIYYFFFLEPPPAGLDGSPTPGLNMTPGASSTESPVPTAT